MILEGHCLVSFKQLEPYTEVLDEAYYQLVIILLYYLFTYNSQKALCFTVKHEKKDLDIRSGGFDVLDKFEEALGYIQKSLKVLDEKGIPNDARGKHLLLLARIQFNMCLLRTIVVGELDEEKLLECAST
jgi:hypothetical protein